MIQVQLKLRTTVAQERELERWLYHLASVWNWGVRKIELNAADSIYFRPSEFRNLLANHGPRLGIPSHTLQGVLDDCHTAWKRCFNRISRRPRLKGKRNRMNSIPFPDPVKLVLGSRIALPLIGSVRLHKQTIPQGNIKRARAVKRSSGWYLCLFIEASPQPIERLSDGIVGIDPGFMHLLTTSEGQKIAHPRELEKAAKRLAQAQRGQNRRLTNRIQERICNRRKDRNHKVSHWLVTDNAMIAFSKDPLASMQRRFGKSVTSSSQHQLRRMIAYKAASSGCEFIEVDCKNSTRTCSNCGALSGPSGLGQLGVRQWVCACGARHDRDVNAAINTLLAALGSSVGSETVRVSGDHGRHG